MRTEKTVFNDIMGLSTVCMIYVCVRVCVVRFVCKYDVYDVVFGGC